MGAERVNGDDACVPTVTSYHKVCIGVDSFVIPSNQANRFEFLLCNDKYLNKPRHLQDAKA